MGEEIDILGSLAPFYPDGVSVGDIEKVKALPFDEAKAELLKDEPVRTLDRYLHHLNKNDKDITQKQNVPLLPC